MIYIVGLSTFGNGFGAMESPSRSDPEQPMPVLPFPMKAYRPPRKKRATSEHRRQAWQVYGGRNGPPPPVRYVHQRYPYIDVHEPVMHFGQGPDWVHQERLRRRQVERAELEREFGERRYDRSRSMRPFQWHQHNANYDYRYRPIRTRIQNTWRPARVAESQMDETELRSANPMRRFLKSWIDKRRRR